MSRPEDGGDLTSEHEDERRSYAGRGMKERIAAGLVLVIGVCGVVASTRLDVGDVHEPGPGLWPLILSVVVAAGGGVLLFTGASADGERFTRESRAVGYGIVSMFVFAALMEHIGFEIPCAVLIVLWARSLGRFSWRLSISVGLLTTLALYLIFVTALGAAIPHAVAF